MRREKGITQGTPGIAGAIKDAIKAVGDFGGKRATEVPPDKKGSAVKPRTRREQQMDELGL
jgi:hypothetical protein